MRTVNIGTLKNQLSAYLQFVRSGEEVIVRDRNVPVARIVPFKKDEELSEDDAYLVASGQMTLAKEKMDWDSFWALPRPAVSDQAVKDAIEWAKGD